MSMGAFSHSHSALMRPSRLDGRVAVVTGANSGIGFGTALGLARLGARVFLACRSEKRGKDAAEKISKMLEQASGEDSDASAAGDEDFVNVAGSADYINLDLGSMESIDDFVKAFEKHVGSEDETMPACDILVLSAGVNSGGAAMQNKGNSVLTSENKDSRNKMFQVNFLGHFYLARRMLPHLRAAGTPSSPSRIVCLSSVMHNLAGTNDGKSFIDWDAVASSPTANPYAETKLALHMLAYEINRRLRARDAQPCIFAVPVNPGAVASGIWRNDSACTKWITDRAFISITQGAQPSIFAAASPSVVTLNPENVYLAPYVPLFDWVDTQWVYNSVHPLLRGALVRLRLLESLVSPLAPSGGVAISAPSSHATNVLAAQRMFDAASTLAGLPQTLN